MNPQAAPEIETVKVSETELEPLYRVVIHNDDATPMDFVVHVLKRIFFLSESDAVVVMLTAHYHGEALAQILPKTEAERRVNKAHFAAGLEGYPLRFSIEPEG